MTVLELPTGRHRMPSLAIRVLGPLGVHVDGQDHTPQAAKLRTLLLTLVLHRPTPLPPDVLIDELWHEPPRSARNVLQSYVSRLRRLFDDVQAEVEHAAGGYRLVLPPDALDLDRYRDALRAADTAASDQDRLSLLSDAVATWQGEPAAELTLGARGDAALCELIDAHLDRREERAVLCLRLGDTATATAELRDLVARRPLQEPTWGHLIDALHAAGNPAAALQAYEQLRQLLAEELGTDPGRPLQRRHAALLAGRSPAPTPSGTTPARATGLVTITPHATTPAGPGSRWVAADRATSTPPAVTTPLLGRETDLARVTEALRRARAVTITGGAGIGKTRLAVEITHPPAEADEPLAFVALDSCRNQRDVLRAIRDALCPGLRADATPAELTTALAGIDGLVVLDAAEGALDACAHVLAGLLRSCPGLRVLTTSQEPLRVHGEHVVPLAPLPLPSAQASFDEQLASPAVRLLVERALAAGWSAPIDARTASRLGALARRLDGLPLAIELAAARLVSLRPDRLLDRLERPLETLRDGPRGTPDRHHTIEAAITANLRLLDDADRALLARLSVAHAALEVEDVRRIAAPDGADTIEVEDAIGRLRRASLLVSDPDDRVRMLGIVRAVAQRQLAGTAQAAEVVARHTAWVLDQADGAEAGQRGPDRARWWQRLRRLRTDIDAVFDRLVHDADVTTVSRLVDALWWHWYLLGDLREALARIDRTLELPGDHDPLDVARLRSVVALFAGLLGDQDRARTEAADAGGLLLAAGDLRRAGMARMVASLGSVRTDPTTAVALAHEALALHEQAGDRWCVAASSQVIAALYMATGDVTGATIHARRSDALFTDLDDPYGIALAAQTRADIALHSGHARRASRQLARSLAAAEAASHTVAIATTVLRLAAACLAFGQTGSGARALGAARALEWQTGFTLEAQLPGLAERVEVGVRNALGERTDGLIEAGARAEVRVLAREILADLLDGSHSGGRATEDGTATVDRPDADRGDDADVAATA